MFGLAPPPRRQWTPQAPPPVQNSGTQPTKQQFADAVECCRFAIAACDARDAGYLETDIARYVERGLLKDDHLDDAERRPGLAATARLTGAAALLASKLDRGR